MRSHLVDAAVLLVVSATSSVALAASSNPTSTTNLLRANGSGEQLGSGDWVTVRAGDGLDTGYSFFIEVPAGTPRLVVEVFDADVGAAGNREGTRDLLTGNRFDTGVIYTLKNPNGSTVSTVTCNRTDGNAPCLDDQWSSLFGTINAPIAGHWQLVVDPSDQNNEDGDETMGFGVRANDGDASGGGQELNVYADSYLGLGPTTATTQTNQFFPWVTAGCFARSNDFDADSSNGTSYALVGNVGFSQTFTSVSGDGAWRVNPTGQFTSDDTAQNYGVWQATATITKQQNNAAANMVTYYVSSPFGATAGTGNPENPRTQPGEAGAYRLYLPQDNGAAPVKPFVEQFVRFASGMNPPQPGLTTTFSITVAVRNPTARAITFNATHVVATTVPAGTAFVAASAVAGQGTIVATPAGGGTGTLRWNPGVVAAGGNAIVAYQVTVTPTSAGQRVLVTGAGTATGTTANYVDETGNTTQSRASYAFGPLCELAVTAGVATDASVVDVAVTRDEGRGGPVRIVWRTRGEAGTVGYTVERDGVVVGRTMSTMSGAGSSYEVVDEDAPDDPAPSYTIVEHTIQGEAHAHGPYPIGTRFDAVDPPPTAAQPPALGLPAPTMHALANAAPAAAPIPSNAALAAQAPAALRIRVDDDALIALPIAQVATLLKKPLQMVRALAQSHALLLEHDGDVAPWDFVHDAIVFAGARASRPFGAGGTFLLSIASPDPHGVVHVLSANAGSSSPSRTSAAATEHYEDDAFDAPVVDIDAFGDLWFWTALAANIDGFHSFSTTLAVPADTGGDASVTVALQGATSSGVPGEHVARVSVDGVVVGDVVFDGLRRAVSTFALPPGLVAEGAVDVAIDAVDPGAPGFNVFYLDSIEVTHERGLDGDAPVAFDAAAGADIAIENADADALLYVATRDDTARARLVRLANAHVVDGALRAHIPVDGRVLFAERPHLATSVEAVAADDLEHGAADVVVIAAHDLEGGARALAAAHAARGLVDRVVDVDTIFDAYANGAHDPRAIQRFLLATRSWTQAPRYVVFVGDADLDYRDALGEPRNRVAPMLLRSETGLAAADALLADVDGDGAPDLAYGRIPAHSDDDVTAYLARAAAFSGPGRAVFASDVDDPKGGAFAESAAGLAQQLSIDTSLVAVQQHAINTARASLFAALPASDLLVYVGHGGLDRMASDGLVMTDDAPALAQNKPLAIVALTCFINRFETLGFEGLGETLLRDGAAVAVIAPSSVGNHSHADELGTHFTARLKNGGAIGDILVDAERTYLAAGGDATLVTSENLLGDPTLPLAPEPGSAPSCASTPGALPFVAIVALLFVRRRWRRP